MTITIIGASLRLQLFCLQAKAGQHCQLGEIAEFDFPRKNNYPEKFEAVRLLALLSCDTVTGLDECNNAHHNLSRRRMLYSSAIECNIHKNECNIRKRSNVAFIFAIHAFIFVITTFAVAITCRSSTCTVE